jgi:hypothetical protein
MPPAARASLEALHAEDCPPRADGGMVYRLVEVLFHLAQGARFQLLEERIAEALGVPADSLRTVRETTGLAARPGRGG